MISLELVQAVLLVLADGPQVEEMTYKHACYTGVAAAQKVLPNVPQRDELMGRGFLSCDGSLKRLKATGELAREKNVAEFGCGYATGAMFAKYGLGEEARVPTARFKAAIESCLSELSLQRVVSKPKANRDGPPWRTIYWNISFDGQPLRCVPLEMERDKLKPVFAARRGHACPESDEGDHLLFTCGEIHEVATFSLESCKSWSKTQLTESETRRMVAFNGCFKTAKPNLGVDVAIAHCSCVSLHVSKYSEIDLSRMPRAKIEAIAHSCARELSGRKKR